jgi:hypothetical protein
MIRNESKDENISGACQYNFERANNQIWNIRAEIVVVDFLKAMRGMIPRSIGRCPASRVKFHGEI